MKFKKLVARLRRRFHKHKYMIEEVYDYPSIIKLPVLGKRLSDVRLICDCGKCLCFKIESSMYCIDWEGTRLAENSGHVAEPGGALDRFLTAYHTEYQEFKKKNNAYVKQLQEFLKKP